MTDVTALATARDQALEVRALYEILEQRFNGRTWSLPELMLGFSHDVGYVGRLLLAHEGTWAVEGEHRSELEHKLAESLWWVFVLADRLDIDITDAYGRTMSTIRTGLDSTIARTAPDLPARPGGAHTPAPEGTP